MTTASPHALLIPSSASPLIPDEIGHTGKAIAGARNPTAEASKELHALWNKVLSAQAAIQEQPRGTETVVEQDVRPYRGADIDPRTAPGTVSSDLPSVAPKAETVDAAEPVEFVGLARFATQSPERTNALLPSSVGTGGFQNSQAKVSDHVVRRGSEGSPIVSSGLREPKKVSALTARLDITTETHRHAPQSVTVTNTASLEVQLNFHRPDLTRTSEPAPGPEAHLPTHLLRHSPANSLSGAAQSATLPTAVTQDGDGNGIAERTSSDGPGIGRSGVALASADRTFATGSTVVSVLRTASNLPRTSGLTSSDLETASPLATAGESDHPEKGIPVEQGATTFDTASRLRAATQDSAPVFPMPTPQAGGDESGAEAGVQLAASIRDFPPVIRNESVASAGKLSERALNGAPAPAPTVETPEPAIHRAPPDFPISPVSSAGDGGAASVSVPRAPDSARMPGRESSSISLPAVGLPGISEFQVSGAKTESAKAGKMAIGPPSAGRESCTGTGNGITVPFVSSTPTAEAGGFTKGVLGAAALPLNSGGVEHLYLGGHPAQQGGMEVDRNQLPVTGQTSDRFLDQVQGRASDAVSSSGLPALASDRGIEDTRRLAGQSSGGVRDLAVGYQDPALGYVELHARSEAGGVHASLVAESAASSATLAGHLDSLSEWMHERRTVVESLTVLMQSSRGGPGSAPGAGQEGYSEQRGHSGQADNGSQRQDEFAGSFITGAALIDCQTRSSDTAGGFGEGGGSGASFPPGDGSRFSVFA